MKKQQKGFTLIELVIVIIILGLLAAAAVPRFANLGTQARIAAVNGVAGGATSAASVVRAQYLATGATTSPILVDGQNVIVTTGAVSAGIPTNAAGGIDLALQNYSGFTFAAGPPATFTPTNGGGATCQVRYNGTTVTIPAAGGVPAIPPGGAVPVTTGC